MAKKFQKNNIVLRFDRGEEIIEGLKTWCTAQGITSAYFSGIGAASAVTISWYDLKQKKYRDKTIRQGVEIVSVSGNIAQLKNELMVHCHGVFTDARYQTHGGHVKKIVVSATAEIVLTPLLPRLIRTYDAKTGLNLIT